MKRLILSSLLFSALLMSCFKGFGQVRNVNGTPQIPNWDFEKWDAIDPWGWNSSETATFGYSPSALKQVRTTYVQDGGRPGSKGTKYAGIKVQRSTFNSYRNWYPPYTWASKADFGTLTTGNLFGYPNKDININHSESCTWTDKGDEAHRTAFTGRPESLVIWVRSAENGGRKSSVHVVLHDDSKYEDRYPNGSAKGTAIGTGRAEFGHNDGAWQRLVIPINYTRNENPSYALVSIHAGNSVKTCVVGDMAFVDDMRFIYPDTLKTEEPDVLTIGLHRIKQRTTPINIPFSIAGTIDHLNIESNPIVAYLSDINGNFDPATQTKLGSIVSEEDGIVKGSVPWGMESSSTYRVRVETKNPFADGGKNEQDIEIYYGWDVSAEPASHKGSVSSDSTGFIREGSTLSFTATANEGNHFTHWTKNGEFAGSDLTYTIESLNEDVDLLAYFDTNVYTVNISNTPFVEGISVGGRSEANGNDKVEIEGQIKYIHGSIVNLSALPEYGYTFTDYTNTANNTVLSNTAFYDFTIFNNMDLLANFDTLSYQLNFLSNNDQYGTTTNTGLYKHFSKTGSTASPQTYCEFLHWVDNDYKDEIISKQNVIEISEVTEAVNYTAVFAPLFFQISTSVQLQDGGTTQGDSLYNAFLITERAKIEAFPNTGYHFIRWELENGDITGDPNANPYVILENGHLENTAHYIAIFDTNRYEIKVDSYANGQIKGMGIYAHEKEVILIAIPDSGYHFVGWEQAGNLFSLADTLNVIATQNQTYQAIFAINEYTVSHSIVPDILYGSTNTIAGTYNHFTPLQLEAVANKGYEFRHWAENGEIISTENLYNFEIDRNRNIDAVFSALRKRLDLSSEPISFGNTKGTGLHEHAENVLIKAIPNYGFHFTHWTNILNDTIANTDEFNFIIDQDTAFTAHFLRNTYKMQVTVNMGEGLNKVSLRPITDTENCTTDSTYIFEEPVFAEALAHPYYTFSHWETPTLGRVSDNPSLLFNLTQDSTLIAVFNFITSQISGVINPEEGGYIEGSGVYNNGSECILVAKAKKGYHFAGWLHNNANLGTKDSLPVLVIQDELYTALFEKNDYILTLQTNLPQAGEVLGAGTFKYLRTAEVQALPIYGYDFIAWIQLNEDGIHFDTLSKKSKFYPIITDHTNLIAVFAPHPFQVNASCLPQKAGSIEGAKEVPYLSTIQLKAVSDYGYHFSHWTNNNGEDLGNNSTLDLEVTRDTNLIVHFIPNTYTLNGVSKPENGGSIEGTGNYLYNEKAKLRISPNPTYDFISWKNGQGEEISKDTVLNVLLSRDSTIHAYFELKKYVLGTKVYPLQAGFANINKSIYTHGDSIELDATPNYGYAFSHWMLNGEQLENSAISKLEATQKGVLTAYFDSIAYNLGMEVYPKGAGTVKGGGEHKYLSTSAIEADAATGYYFVAWINEEPYADIYENLGNVNVQSYEPKYSVQIKGDRKIYALFKAKTYSIASTENERLYGTSTGGGIYKYDDNISLKAYPEYGYQFMYWTQWGEDATKIAAIENPWLFTVKTDGKYIANFAPDSFNVSLSQNIDKAGHLKGEGRFEYKTPITIEAQASTGYVFSHWTEYRENISTDSVYRFTLMGHTDLQAHFIKKTYTLNVYCNIENSGEVSGTGLYQHGDIAYLEAMPSKNYLFSHWTIGENKISDVPMLEIPITSNLTVTAHFTLKTHEIHLISEPLEGGEVSGGGNYLFGSKVMLTASPNTHFSFERWGINGKTISTDSVFEYTIEGNKIITAYYREHAAYITAKSNKGSAGEVSGSGKYYVGDTAHLKAIANYGYTFSYWTRGLNIISKDLQLDITVDETCEYIAHFKPITYMITLSSFPVHGGTTVGDGTYYFHDSIEIEAIALEGYAFLHWTFKDKVISDQVKTKILVTEEANLTAQFIRTSFIVDVKAYPKEGGIVKGNGTYKLGDTVTIEAIPDKLYYFDEWVDLDMMSQGNSMIQRFVIDHDIEYVSLFTKIQGSGSSNDENVSVYPNPFRECLNIEGKKLKYLEIFNLHGSLVAAYDLNDSFNKIPAQSIALGIYLYRIRMESGTIFTGKIIKF